MAQVLEAAGVAIREHCGFRGFRRKTAGLSAADTDAGGDRPPTPSSSPPAHGRRCSNDQLGCRVPIQPGKGYSLTMPRPATCPTIPLIFPETRVAVTPFQSGYRLGSTMEFAGYDDDPNPIGSSSSRTAQSRTCASP